MMKRATARLIDILQRLGGLQDKATPGNQGWCLEVKRVAAAQSAEAGFVSALVLSLIRILLIFSQRCLRGLLFMAQWATLKFVLKD